MFLVLFVIYKILLSVGNIHIIFIEFTQIFSKFLNNYTFFNYIICNAPNFRFGLCEQFQLLSGVLWLKSRVLKNVNFDGIFECDKDS